MLATDKEALKCILALEMTRNGLEDMQKENVQEIFMYSKQKDFTDQLMRFQVT